MRITVRFFAMLRDHAGVSEWGLDLPEGADVVAASGALADRFPAIRDYLQGVAFAVNRTYVPADTVLSEGDELALIPPVSGG